MYATARTKCGLLTKPLERVLSLRSLSSMASPKLVLDQSIERLMEKSNEKTSSRSVSDTKKTEGAKQEEVHTPISEMNLNPLLVRNLPKMGVEAFFPIQKATFDPIMKGQDLIARAKTGTGKTLAFLVPILEHILAAKKESVSGKKGSPLALVLCPTRELAIQISRVVTTLCESSTGNRNERITSMICYGGTSVRDNLRDLRSDIDLVVGTPGRVLDLSDNGALQFDRLKVLCFDEADHMLDIGFSDQMESIMKNIRTHQKLEDADSAKHQTVLFSATMPEWVRSVSQKYFREKPTMINLVQSDDNQSNENIRHIAVPCASDYQFQVVKDLISLYRDQAKKILIFTSQKSTVHNLGTELQQTSGSFRAEPVHGGMEQALREEVLDRFRQGITNCLVTTDLAARGLDIPNVDLVIQFDVSQTKKAESFLHRSGRTGRAGKKGTNILVYDPLTEKNYLRLIQNHAKFEFELQPAPSTAVIRQTRLASLKETILLKSNSPQSGVDVMIEQFVKEILAEMPSAESLAMALTQTAIGSPLDSSVTDEGRSVVTAKPGVKSLLVNRKVSMPSYQWQSSVKSLVDTWIRECKTSIPKTALKPFILKDGQLLLDVETKFAESLLTLLNQSSSVHAIVVGDHVPDVVGQGWERERQRSGDWDHSNRSRSFSRFDRDRNTRSNYGDRDRSRTGSFYGGDRDRSRSSSRGYGDRNTPRQNNYGEKDYSRSYQRNSSSFQTRNGKNDSGSLRETFRH